MKPSRILSAFLTLLAIGVATPADADQIMGRARSRPFSDWLDKQGTLLGGSGRPILIVWQDNPFTTGCVVDISGKMGAWITAHGGPAFPSQHHGTVTERTLADGTAQVTVNHQFEDVYCYVNQAPGTVFGYTPTQSAGHPEYDHALAKGQLQLVFTIPSPGAPLYDLVDLMFFAPPGTSVSTVKTHFVARGPLNELFGVPAGTPGMCVVIQNGLFVNPGGGATTDGFPVEHVKLRAIGAEALGSGDAELSQSRAPAPVAAPSMRTSWGRIKAHFR